MMSVSILEIRRRLGVDLWRAPRQFGTGWRLDDNTGSTRIVVTEAVWAYVPIPVHVQVKLGIESIWTENMEIIHASISHPDGDPTYAELKALHAAVWPNGHAVQCFVPPTGHINIHAHALHLWGRSDGESLLPVDFGQFGTI